MAEAVEATTSSPDHVPARLTRADYTPDIRRKLREVRKVSARLARYAEDSTRRVQLVGELREAGLTVTAIADFAGVSAAALHKSKRRADAKKDPGGL